MSRACLLGLFALSTACSDYTLSGNGDARGAGEPEIQVLPEIVEFGSVGDGEVVIETFVITNIGDGDLEIENIEIGAQNGSFTILTTDWTGLLPVDASQEIEVAFSPMGANGQSANAIVYSNDTVVPQAKVELFGEGAVPELSIDPDPYDMGDTYVGCATLGAIDLVNVGTDTLTITDIAFSGDSFTFSQGASLPLVLEPGETHTADIDFDPELSGAFDGLLTVTSDEPLGVREATQTGSGKYAATYADEWTLDKDPPSDIVFSVDQSCSMNDDVSRLANNFEDFINELSNYTSDWRVIVVNQDNGCNHSGILTPSTTGFANTFKNTIQSGGGGSYTEALLTIASAAARQMSAGCNASFLREDAMLHFIMVSDEPEQSRGTWDQYVNEIISYKGNASLVRISAIAGDYPNGCGSNAAGVGYYEAVNYTGGEFLSICSATWSGYMNKLAQASINQSDFALSATAVESTIVVKVNSNVNTKDWHFDSSSNAVVFDTNVPEGGDNVKITYAGLANCD
jgi:hypothetical protein